MTNDEARMTNNPASSRSFAIDGGENQMEFLCLLPQRTSGILCTVLRCGDHPEPVLCFASLLLTGADLDAKFFLGNRIIGFAVVGPHTCRGPNQLVDQRQGNNIPGDLFGEGNNGFPEACRPFFQIELALSLPPIQISHETGPFDSSFDLRHSFVIGHSVPRRALHSSRSALAAVAPTRVTPNARTASSRSNVRTPPAALTCTCGGEQRRISFKSSSVAPESP